VQDPTAAGTAAPGAAAPQETGLEAGTSTANTTAGTPATRGSAPSAVRAGAARAGGAHPAGSRDAASGPDAAAAATPPGAALADAARAIGERLRSASTDRPAETAQPGASPFAAMSAPTAGPAREPLAAEAPPPAYPITVPVRDPRFADAFGERISWMLREGLQVAELTLHPQELGPIRIELSLEGDAATIGVVAAQAETRGAIEQALPRLRELLAQQGVALGGSTVDAGTQQNARGDARDEPPRRGRERDAELAPTGLGGPERAVRTTSAARAGRIDVFA
jgi:flagellar hook-length control protein FliK